MVKVLVLGASGFVGFPVAQALCRAGHQVYGLTRSESKAKQLAAQEITPIIGEPHSKSWHNLISTLDVIIDVIGGSANFQVLSPTILNGVIKAAQTLRPDHAPKLSFIYTTGTWIHGDNREAIITDTTPLTNPYNLVAWRLDQEKRLITEPAINVIIIRPPLVYGRGGSLLSPLFEAASKGKVVWPGIPGGRYALIHTDDLADLYVKVAEKAPILGGQIFDAANDQTESVDDLLQKLVKISGARGPFEYTIPQNDFEIALSGTTLARPYLGRALVDWHPKKPGLIDGLEVYYASYLAQRSQI